MTASSLVSPEDRSIGFSVPALPVVGQHCDGLGGGTETEAQVVIREREDVEVGKGADSGEAVVVAGDYEPLDSLAP